MHLLIVDYHPFTLISHLGSSTQVGRMDNKTYFNPPASNVYMMSLSTSPARKTHKPYPISAICPCLFGVTQGIFHNDSRHLTRNHRGHSLRNAQWLNFDPCVRVAVQLPMFTHQVHQVVVQIDMSMGQIPFSLPARWGSLCSSSSSGCCGAPLGPIYRQLHMLGTLHAR